jgi:hypothetical protein
MLLLVIIVGPGAFSLLTIPNSFRPATTSSSVLPEEISRNDKACMGRLELTHLLGALVKKKANVQIQNVPDQKQCK